jgi:hypothetical protein
MVAIDGFWFTDADESSANDEDGEQGPFEQHYDAATRAALPFMRATDMDPSSTLCGRPASSRSSATG